MKLAIFDIDGTLVRGSSERMFWRYLAARGRQGPRQIFAYLLFLLRYLPTGGIHTIKKNKAYLCGLQSTEVEALAAEFVNTRLMKRLYEPKHAEVVRINPKRQVPVLIHGELEIFDSTQIFEYFEDLQSEPALWPAGAAARA